MMEWIVTSSAMILIVIALRGLLKGKISLKLQYGLWALVLVRLLLPFSIVDSAISISNILSAPVIREADTAVSDYRSSYESLRDEYNQKSESVTDEEIRLQVQQELYDHAYTKLEQEYSHSGATVLQTQIQAEAQQQVQVISLTAVITEALPYLWVVGMVVASAVLIGSNIHFWWKLRQNRTALDIPGVPLKVYLTDYVATPCLFGLGKPDIYLTNEVMTDSQMRRHVLAHEMSHYRQGDHLWSVMRSLCLVLHWYNPLVWAAAILSKQDAELACDEATIKALGENERTAYGRTLIGMTCVRRDPRSLMLTATTMLGTKKTLKERISLIAKKPKTALYTLIACVLVAAIAVGCTFTGAPSDPTEPSTEPTTEPTNEPTAESTEPSTSEPADPTEPAQEEASLYLEKCRLALEELQNRDYVVLNEWKSTDDPDIMLAWHTAKYVHSGDDWAISKLMDPVTTFYYLEVDGVQYVRYQSEHPDTAYPDWTVADLSAPEHEFSDDCWILEYQWDPDTITYQGFELRNGTEIISLNLFDADTSEITGVMELKIDKDGHLKNLSKVLYSYGPNGETCELTSEIEVYSTSENYCSGQIADYYYQTTPEYHYQVLLHEEWTYRIVGCVFEKPEDISLAYLFYRGLPVEEREDPSQYSQAEVDFLKSKLKDSFWGEEAWDDAFKFPADRLNEILNQYLGVSLDEVKIPNRWYYFSETDAYYDVRTDSYAARGITVTEVEVAENGNVLVHYKVEHLFNQMTDDFLADAEMVMTLQVLENGSHQILSNVIDPDSTYYLLYTSGLARLFQTGSPKVYIDNNKAKPIRIIPVNEEIVHGLMEHLNHYNWQKIDGPIQRAEKDPFREQIYFRNQGTFDQGVNLTLTVWEDGSYQLGYWDNLETTCYYLGTPKSDTYGSAAEDLRNFHETFWPETDE